MELLLMGSVLINIVKLYGPRCEISHFIGLMYMGKKLG